MTCKFLNKQYIHASCYNKSAVAHQSSTKNKNKCWIKGKAHLFESIIELPRQPKLRDQIPEEKPRNVIPSVRVSLSHKTFEEVASVLNALLQRRKKRETLFNSFCKIKNILTSEPHEVITREKNFKSISLMNKNTKQNIRKLYPMMNKKSNATNMKIKYIKFM